MLNLLERLQLPIAAQVYPTKQNPIDFRVESKFSAGANVLRCQSWPSSLPASGIEASSNSALPP
jgi:hypothetical protein